MRKVALAAFLASSFAAPAFAQDASFSGFRAEGIAGYDRLQSGEEGADGDDAVQGVAFGVGVGYDFDLGGLVAGVEGEFTESTGEEDENETINGIDFTSSLEVGRDLYVGGRIGFKAGPRTLLYVKGGYTNTSIEAAIEDDSDRFELDTNVDGWRLGAGGEMLVGTNMYAKLEYRYSNYNKLDFSDDFDFDGLDPEDVQTDIDLDRHQVMLGLGWRF